MSALVPRPMRGTRAFTTTQTRPRLSNWARRASAGAEDNAPDLANINRSGRNPLAYRPSTPSSSPQSYDQLMTERYGKDMYERHERVFRDERQRLWDNIREIAKVRYEHGLMPLWFKPEWLEMKEPPVNQFMRERVGSEVYWENYQPDGDDPPTPDNGDSGNGNDSSGGSGGGGGSDGWWWSWWREDDPFWPLRGGGGAHAALWLTWATAMLWAAHGLLLWAVRQDADALRSGMGAASLLGCCAMAMSDMTHGEYGALAVKFAFMLCFAKAWQEISAAWAAQGKVAVGPMAGQALLMCLLYVRTDMSGLEDLQIPNLQEATSRLKIPTGNGGAGAGEKVWVDYLGKKLGAYMQLRTQRIKTAALEPRHPLDVELLASHLKKAAGPGAGAAAAAAS